MQQIPNADLKEFLSGNSKTKAAFTKKIGTSFQEIGFLALRGHLLEDKLQDELYKEIHSFFKLSNKIKS